MDDGLTGQTAELRCALGVIAEGLRDKTRLIGEFRLWDRLRELRFASGLPFHVREANGVQEVRTQSDES